MFPFLGKTGVKEALSDAVCGGYGPMVISQWKTVKLSSQFLPNERLVLPLSLNQGLTSGLRHDLERGQEKGKERKYKRTDTRSPQVQLISNSCFFQNLLGFVMVVEIYLPKETQNSE